MYDSIERYPVYNPAISRRRCALAYFTLHAAMQGMAIAYESNMKVPKFCRSAVVPNVFFSPGVLSRMS